MTQKYRIGKNGNGWYLAVPSFWGSFSVLEGIPSHADAIEVFDRHRAQL